MIPGAREGQTGRNSFEHDVKRFGNLRRAQKCDINRYAESNNRKELYLSLFRISALKMKIRTVAFRCFALTFVMLTLLSINSCSSDKEFTIRGTIQDIENGKDGYTATLKDDDGADFDAVISKVKLGNEYRVLTVGERVELSGDTLHPDNKLRIIVKKISR